MGGAEASDYIDLGVSEREYRNPTISNVRLDWCYATGTLCGWNAAFEFCKLAGYATAVDFQFDLLNLITKFQLIGFFRLFCSCFLL